MPEPILTAVATALATKAATGLYDLVKAKFARNSHAEAELEAAAEAPDDPQRIEALATRLAEAERSDPEFGAALRTQYAIIIHNQQLSSGKVINQVTGNADKLVQARDIHGNISL
jgi:hypothetical protein